MGSMPPPFMPGFPVPEGFPGGASPTGVPAGMPPPMMPPGYPQWPMAPYPGWPWPGVSPPSPYGVPGQFDFPAANGGGEHLGGKGGGGAGRRGSGQGKAERRGGQKDKAGAGAAAPATGGESGGGCKAQDADGEAPAPPPPPENGTTVMLRNIPNRYTQSMLVSLLDEHGFTAGYDFVYLPMDFRNGVNLGYAFVNLLKHEDALRLMTTFQGFSKWFFDSAKVCEVSWAHPHQGLEEHVERYRNSPVMHPSMPQEYKPMMFQNGVRVAFPPPTKAIRAPKLRPVHDNRAGGVGGGGGTPAAAG
mmetsp:Transcript_42077/g.105863  ORF Transcript_42077/g.105863 Transcript_42077/m.105863 type:complete len:303 (+) Transcript_42077:3-911(+)